MTGDRQRTPGGNDGRRRPGRRTWIAGLGVAALIAVGYTVGAAPAARAAEPAAEPSAAVSRAQLTEIIEDVTKADGYRYGSTDSVGNTMDTAKVIDNPGGGYLSVYHTGSKVKLATSTDLKDWTFKANLQGNGTQPHIVATSDGGYVVADEGNDGGGFVRVAYYANERSLFAGKAARTFKAPRTLSRCNEGTPNIFSVRLNPDIDHSVIDLGMHYHHNCDTDREATARLTNFTGWKATPAPSTDNALVQAAGLLGRKVGGNIGDRDAITYDRRLYTVNEVQFAKGNFGTWRSFLYDFETGRAEPLNIHTHGGSTSFANPSVSHITAPNGDPAIAVTLFLPNQGAASGEAGELIYYRTLPGSAG